MGSMIVMACSATKKAVAGNLPAMERYDGPMWRTLRAALSEREDRNDLDVWFLSAQYGFHPAELEIVNYERQMTETRARDLLSTPTSNWRAFADAALSMERVLLAGGYLYRHAMLKAIGKVAAKNKALVIDETDGGGIGIHRQQLRQWISGQSAQPLPSQLSLGFSL